MADKDNTPSGSITCPKCMHLNSSGMKKCSRCGVVMLEYDGEDREPAKTLSAEIILTTSFILANKVIDHEIEVISAECVFGMNIFRDFFAGVRDIVGGRSAAIQKVLRDGRRTALTELRKEALLVGADAVIGIDLDYQELSGGGKSGMLMIVVSGTAVTVKKKDDANDGS